MQHIRDKTEINKPASAEDEEARAFLHHDRESGIRTKLIWYLNGARAALSGHMRAQLAGPVKRSVLTVEQQRRENSAYASARNVMYPRAQPRITGAALCGLRRRRKRGAPKRSRQWRRPRNIVSDLDRSSDRFRRRRGRRFEERRPRVGGAVCER